MVRMEKCSLIAVLLVAALLLALMILREKIPASWTTVEWPWREALPPAEITVENSWRFSYSATYEQDGVTYTLRVPNPDGKATPDELRERAYWLIAERVGPGLDEDYRERVEFTASVG